MNNFQDFYDYYNYDVRIIIIILKIKEIPKNDARYTVRDIARIVGTSLSSVNFILKKILKNKIL